MCSLYEMLTLLVCAGFIGPSAVPYFNDANRPCPATYSGNYYGGESAPPNGGNDFGVPGLGLNYIVRWVAANSRAVLLRLPNPQTAFLSLCHRVITPIPELVLPTQQACTTPEAAVCMR